MHWLVGESFTELLAAWRHHDDMRRMRAPLPKLVAARDRLEEARSEMYRRRLRLAPREDERENEAFTVVCPELEEAISVPWRDVIRINGSMQFRCLCGEDSRAHVGAAG